MANMKPLVGYIRVSTGKQAESGLSLEAQEAKIRAMATLKGVALLDVIVDAAESAKDLNRPGVQQVLKMIRTGAVSGVIIAKLDRLTRSVRDFGDIVELFNRKDAALVSVHESIDTGSAVGRMILNVMMSVFQWERESAGERTSDALQAKRARGERAGNVPYGYVSDEAGRLTEDPAEQKVVAEIKKRRKAGETLREIADALNAANLKTRRGTEWRFQYIHNILGEKPE